MHLFMYWFQAMISNLKYEVDLIFWSYISKKSNDSDVTFVCDDDIKINAH